jgi:hypothetical protein
MLEFAELISGIQQGKVCENGISSTGAGNDVFGNRVLIYKIHS